MVVQYIMKNREMFEPFIEDEVPFEQYCQSMEKDGTWAGHMELQAASLVTRNNICIHLHRSPRWCIQNFGCHGSMIHLSYHDGEHYNSVRMKEDPCDGPARPVSIKADVNLTASSEAAKIPSARSNGKTSEYSGIMKMVMDSSNCNDAEKVEQVLQLVDGDADAAVEFLIAERDLGEAVEQNCVLFEDDIDNKGFDDNKNSNKLVHKGAPANGVDQSVDAKTVVSCKSSSIVDKKIPRNKVCSCGSKKKYKACCGAATGRASSKFQVEHETNSARGSRGKQGKKGKSATKAPSTRSDGAVPDMGALCI
ncbi:OVARIAN TUMOR DOMAIN-containing deubiquitinating enzyme 7 isoform X2 [Silene latifolia]